MVDANVGYLAGSPFYFRKTTDGGVTWLAEPNPDPGGPTTYVGPQGNVYGLTVPDADHPWTAGYDIGTGLIYHRMPQLGAPLPANPNAPWRQELPGGPALTGIDAVSTTTAWAVGVQGYVWKTTNSGDSWGQQTSARDVVYGQCPQPFGCAPGFNDVDAVDANTAWAVAAMSGYGGPGMILKTSDGGTNWVLQTTDTQILRRVHAVDASTAWVVGDAGVILKTTDGGTTWTKQLSGTTRNLTDVEAVSATTAWVSQDDGTILKTTDGGTGAWAAPTITSVSPALVALNGDTIVTLTGTGFRGGSLAVTFGTPGSPTGTPGAGSATWISPTSVQVATPSFNVQVNGVWTPVLTPQAVTLTNEDGQSATLPSAVTAIRTPVLTGFSPWHGSVAGGYQVTIDGWYLQTVNGGRTPDDAVWQPRRPSRFRSRSISSIPSGRHDPDVVHRTPDDGNGYIKLLTPLGQYVYLFAAVFRLDPTTGPEFAVDSVAPRPMSWTSGPVTVTGVGFTDTSYFEVCGNEADDQQPERHAADRDRRRPKLDSRLVQPACLQGHRRVRAHRHRRSRPVTSTVSRFPLSRLCPRRPGLPAGGTTVTLNGTNLNQSPQTTVLFDGFEAVTVSRTATQLVVTTPAHALGTVDVTVIPTDDGDQIAPAANAASAFTYANAPLGPPPTLTSIAPVGGTTAGGTTITLTGTGFLAGASVTLGGTPATSVVVVNGSSITAVTPAHAAGAVDVKVVNADTQAATLAGAFTFVVPSPLTLTGVHPAVGTMSGGTIVSITGAGFLAAATAGPLVSAAAAGAVPVVTIGGIAATAVTVVSDTLITVISPALPASATGEDVVVSFGDGASSSLAKAFTPVNPGAPMADEGDGLPSDWELMYSLDPTDAADGAQDPDGDGKSNAEEYAAGTHPRGLVTRYLAEGATAPLFETWLALANFGDAPRQVLMRFQKGDGATQSLTAVVAPHTRWSSALSTVPSMGEAEFSTVVEADGELLVDRTMTWSRDQVYGSHAEHGLVSPATTWYLAEGATHSGFDLFYLIQNPNDTAVDVRVRYLRPPPLPPLEKTYTVGARRRFNIWVNSEEVPVGSGEYPLAATDLSAVLEAPAGLPIIVERAMYLSNQSKLFNAGHESAGVTAPAERWFLAEGNTGPFFDLFVLVANPGDAEASVRFTYLLPDGTTYVRTTTVAGNSRYNAWVDYETPDGTIGYPLADTAVSTTVESLNGVPIIVERAMWWPGTAATWHEAHNSPGSTETGAVWGLAEGEVGGVRGLETYVLIANTSAFEGRAKVTVFFEDGTSSSRSVTLKASSRTNVAIGAPESVGGFGDIVKDRRFATLVESEDAGDGVAALVVERAMYSSTNRALWAAGTNALATKIR